MGCTPSKEGENGNDSVKTAKNRYIRAERPTKSVVNEAADAGTYALMKGYETDPRCPLSERQLYSIVKSWKAINREMSQTAVNMFVRLLEIKEIREIFTAFKDCKTVSDLRANRLFQEHAMMVISTIDEVISNLDDMEYVFAMLTATGEAHSIRFKNFRAENFWKVEDAFLWSVKETLDDRYTVSIEGIYKATIRFILQTLYESFQNHRGLVINSTIEVPKDHMNGANSTAIPAGDIAVTINIEEPAADTDIVNNVEEQMDSAGIVNKDHPANNDVLDITIDDPGPDRPETQDTNGSVGNIGDQAHGKEEVDITNIHPEADINQC